MSIQHYFGSYEHDGIKSDFLLLYEGGNLASIWHDEKLPAEHTRAFFQTYFQNVYALYLGRQNNPRLRVYELTLPDHVSLSEYVEGHSLKRIPEGSDLSADHPYRQHDFTKEALRDWLSAELDKQFDELSDYNQPNVRLTGHMVQALLRELKE